jgi:hypothetical protein
MKKVLVLFAVTALALASAGCGSNHGNDAAAAISSGISGAFSDGLTNKPSSIALGTTNPTLMDRVSTGATNAAQEALARVQSMYDEKAGTMRAPLVHADTSCGSGSDWCTLLCQYSDWVKYTTPDGRWTAGFGCTGTSPNQVVAITVTAAKSLSVSDCGNTYTIASGGTVSLSWPDAAVTAFSANTTFTLSINDTMTGGKLASSGSTVACSFSFNLQTFQSNPTCSGLTGYACTVDGSAVNCSDWQSSASSSSCASATFN